MGYEGWNEGTFVKPINSPQFRLIRSHCLLQQNKLGKLEDTDLLLGVQSGMTPDFRQFVAVTFGFTQSLANFRVTKPEAFK